MKSFVVENIMTWGLDHDKEYGGFKLPVSFREKDSIVKQIEKLVEKYQANKIFYGDSKTAYFKIWKLSKNQQKNLLGTGKQFIDLAFDVEDKPIESKKGNLYIKMIVTGLRISEKSNALTPKEEF